MEWNRKWKMSTWSRSHKHSLLGCDIKQVFFPNSFSWVSLWWCLFADSARDESPRVSLEGVAVVVEVLVRGCWRGVVEGVAGGVAVVVPVRVCCWRGVVGVAVVVPACGCSRGFVLAFGKENWKRTCFVHAIWFLCSLCWYKCLFFFEYCSFPLETAIWYNLTIFDLLFSQTAKHDVLFSYFLTKSPQITGFFYPFRRQMMSSQVVNKQTSRATKLVNRVQGLIDKAGDWLLFEVYFFFLWLMCVCFFFKVAGPWNFETAKIETVLRFLSFSFLRPLLNVVSLATISAARWMLCKNASMTWAKDQRLFAVPVVPRFALVFWETNYSDRKD